jgi:ABC-2 type transport system permease protein
VNTLRLTGVQIRYVNKAFWRNPASAFFTFAFPLMFLVIFTALLGHYTIHLGSRTIYTSTYYVASMACFSVITACFNNIATAVSFQREDGILKRAHGTPLPGASFLGARILHAVLVAVLLVIITAAFGRLVYTADIPTGLSLLRFMVALLVGAAAFCALGLAATAVIPNSDAAAPIINAIILPLEFLSGIFIAFDNNTPAWILWAAKVFPIRHFVLSMQSAFLGAAFSWTDVLIVAAWGIAGVLLAIRFFTWEPRQG